jgi:alpha-glucoside transport system permease protein
LAAFGFAWVPFPFRDTLFLLIVALMIVPIQTSLVPLLKLFANNGHLNNHYYGIWLAHTAFGLPLAVFLLRNFFVTLPKDLIEAARIDGASNLAIFRRIVVPLSVPALASFAIFQFLWVWNDLLMALIFVSDPSKQPMTVRIPYLLSTYGQEYNLLAAAAFLLMALPLVVFFSLQRYFVQGLLAGSVKT